MTSHNLALVDENERLGKLDVVTKLWYEINGPYEDDGHYIMKSVCPFLSFAWTHSCMARMPWIAITKAHDRVDNNDDKSCRTQ